MWARVTTVRILSAASLDHHLHVLDDEVLPALQELPAVVGGYWLVNRHLARVVGVVLYDSEASMRATAEAAAALRSSTIHRIGGTLESVQEFEVIGRIDPPPRRRRRTSPS